jgi:hypothetical protein
MSHSVPAVWKPLTRQSESFCSPDKGFAQQRPGLAKMWVEWSVGGVADLAERNPEPPTGGEAYTDLLGAVKPALLNAAYFPFP